jgi:hypothetical protein
MILRHAQPSSGVSSRKESRPSTPADTDSDYHRPSFSDATPRPTPSQPHPLGQESSALPTNDTLLAPSSKRLGFFADKLSGAQSHSHHQQSASTSGLRTSPVPSHSNSTLLPPRSHSRDSSSLSPMASSSSTANAAKVHTSPSKVSDKLPMKWLILSAGSQQLAEHMTPDSSHAKCTG